MERLHALGPMNRKTSPRIWIALILLLAIPQIASAQWHAVGLAGTWTRLEANTQNFTFFQLGPSSTTTPVIGVEGGRSVWKVTVDGTFLSTTTGQTQVVIGPGQQATQTTNGHAIYFDGGGEWPLLSFKGFRIVARGGYGTARVHVPTEFPIDDHRQFWTYGIAATRDLWSRYLLRIDLRNVHFRGSDITDIPETLGRFNIAVLAGFGLKF